MTAATAKKTTPRRKQPEDHKPPSRPSLERKTTRRTEDDRRSAMEAGMAVEVAGERYEVRFGDIRSSIARKFRQQTQMSWSQMMDQLTSDAVDIDTVAAFVFLARLNDGEQVELDDIDFTMSELFGPGGSFEIDKVDGAADDDKAAGDVDPEE